MSHPEDDHEKIADLLNKYGLLAIPVLAKNNKMLGIITVDDVLELLVPDRSSLETFSHFFVSKRSARRVMSLPRFSLRRVWLFLAIIGPGLVTANVDNDAGGIATYSIAGASFGYKLLWTLIPMTLALIIVQEMCARMGAVTGKGLADLIRERFGVKITFYAMIGLLFANFGTTVSEFAGVGASMELFGVSKYISVPLGALLVWWLVLKGSYKVVERVFLFLCLIYFCYVPSGIMANPPWGEVMRQLVIPHFSLDSQYLTHIAGSDRHHHCPLDAVLHPIGSRGKGYYHQRLWLFAPGRHRWLLYDRFHCHVYHRGLCRDPAYTWH